MKVIICNAFSLNMLETFPTTIKVTEVSEEWIKAQNFEFQSYIGHPSTTDLVSARLGKQIAFNRTTLKLTPGTEILVVQLMGDRKEFKEMTQQEIQQYPIKYFWIKVEAEK